MTRLKRSNLTENGVLETTGVFQRLHVQQMHNSLHKLITHKYMQFVVKVLFAVMPIGRLPSIFIPIVIFNEWTTECDALFVCPSREC
ncbi:hypothetical protein L596_001412 [Steinernema carpocapsae]|uniref:Uncharacterized protein n=1 Tax=Steinernema carpocapsae TaxID=34508 RepID=A0A4U8ULP6_STECR|nr:hypothetical protein L596_001412 [Steinernema carpocapsae]